MHVSSLELSKELYELSGWRSSLTYMLGTYLGEWRSEEQAQVLQGWESVKVGSVGYGMKVIASAYDLGYLLRKLPIETMLKLDMTSGWDCWGDYGGQRIIGNDPASPEDAAAKLAIELFKQGVLVKDDKGLDLGE